MNIIAIFGMAFSTAQRPILREVFRQLEDRGTRYEPLLMKLFPPETRPRQREVLIEIYRKGKIAEAFRAFRKIYLEIVDQVIDHLKSQEAGDFLQSRSGYSWVVRSPRARRRQL